ncbi:hypothetical protein phi1422_0055 [Bdellovibrio phage phi1422]|uniref:hypothetical protein n=1 Tax=Bdellovibrio phage phi1422 TaxID=1127515 RepID=UPI0002536D6B|nr:hypothetical protein F395_gp55 [Bdellovibrio phage phi1422]AFC22575.1 hypothetical protein phi1422_0055 [Bdellovibrio phage phi1422]
MQNLSLDNVFTISVSEPGAPVGAFNTSNVAVFTHEVAAPSFGSDGYKIFISPEGIAADFGSNSITAKLINAIFGQKPNIRQNNGYAVVVPMLPAIRTINFDAVPASGQFILDIAGGDTAPILFNDNAAAVQAKVRAIGSAYANAVVTGDFATGFVITFKGSYGDIPVVIEGNTLETVAPAPVVATVVETQAGETAKDALIRADGLVEFFGFIFTRELNAVDMDALGEANAPLRKIGVVVGSAEADLEAGGKLEQLTAKSYRNTRGVYYGGADSIKFPATFIGRALCVNFSGNNTTLTMHLKDQVGLAADPTITQNILQKAKTAGAEIFGSFRGVAKTYTSGANDFFDNVYNLLAFIELLQVAEFNLYGQTPTKIPQTDGGSDAQKKVARGICEQFVTNQFLSPGEWTRPETFGDQEEFLENIRQRGYFIYMQPVSQQPVADRENREAPLMQIAIKYAGANHSGSAIIAINK